MATTQIKLTLDTGKTDTWLDGLKTAVAANSDLCREVEGLLDAGGDLWSIEPADLVAGKLTLGVVPTQPLTDLLAKYGVSLDVA